MVFFWVHEFENIDFLKEFWSKNVFFLKVFQVVQEGLGGVSINFFGVLRLLGAYISGWNWSCMWWRILVHLNKFEMDFPCERWRRILSTIFALLFKGKSKILTRGSCLTVSWDERYFLTLVLRFDFTDIMSFKQYYSIFQYFNTEYYNLV